jgi:hypothetical protein
MNRVPLARRIQVINCLVEGNSIRSTERMTGTHRDTICRLLVEVGDGCAKLMDEQMRELPCRRIDVDVIWAYVGKKQRHTTPLDDPRLVGDQYTFVALDPETKIVPAYWVGKRDLPTATAFYNGSFRETGKPDSAVIRRARSLRRSNRAGFRRRYRLRPRG